MRPTLTVAPDAVHPGPVHRIGSSDSDPSRGGGRGSRQVRAWARARIIPSSPRPRVVVVGHELGSRVEPDPRDAGLRRGHRRVAKLHRDRPRCSRPFRRRSIALGLGADRATRAVMVCWPRRVAVSQLLHLSIGDSVISSEAPTAWFASSRGSLSCRDPVLFAVDSWPAGSGVTPRSAVGWWRPRWSCSGTWRFGTAIPSTRWPWPWSSSAVPAPWRSAGARCGWLFGWPSPASPSPWPRPPRWPSPWPRRGAGRDWRSDGCARWWCWSVPCLAANWQQA